MNIEELKTALAMAKEARAEAYRTYLAEHDNTVQRLAQELAEAECPFMVGDVLIATRGQACRARVTSIKPGIFLGFQMYGNRITKDGHEGAEFKLHDYRGWKKEQSNDQ